eukprot:CAMPEP_0194290716 /NCGR_PEP_ID=MMETSP0169-20130528/41884_1 /TAXON_ID=218684 /ORGANISM="Corethron pennatum, Strain L29A3" /LENGTH=83 /DNA_ID=CAMNT_0039038393 /DNA_START=59 /DNA_END=306 /DNA_ORIENTATION=-
MPSFKRPAPPVAPREVDDGGYSSADSFARVESGPTTSKRHKFLSHAAAAKAPGVHGDGLRALGAADFPADFSACVAHVAEMAG